MAVDLFGMLRDVFESNDLSRYSEQELKNMGFAVNRIMSIKYPGQANSQNAIGINYANVVKYWAVNMKGKYEYTPDWTKVATAKARKEYQSKVGEIEMPEKEILAAFMKFHKIEHDDLVYLVKRKPKEIKELFDQYEASYTAK